MMVKISNRAGADRKRPATVIAAGGAGHLTAGQSVESRLHHAVELTLQSPRQVVQRRLLLPGPRATIVMLEPRARAASA